MVPTSGVVDALLHGSDALRSMVNNVESSDDVEVGEYVEVLKAVVEQEAPSEEAAESATPTTPEPPPEPAAKTEEPPPPVAQPSAAPPLQETSLRVNVKILDTLMNLAGELVLKQYGMDGLWRRASFTLLPFGITDLFVENLRI